jgi:acetyl esterase/lipase
MKRKCIAILAILLASAAIAQAQKTSQKVIQLYQGKPPGSEDWTWTEAVNDSNTFHFSVVYNVVEPTLTVFRPSAGTSNGTSVIIAPGGGFHLLSINSEGNDVAKWLAAKGVTAFVLRYRLVHCTTKDPVKELMSLLGNRKRLDSANEAVVPLAIQDGLVAMDYVRKHAATYKINPDRIGFMGFSAGGTVTMGVVYGAKAENRPNFIAPVYAYVSPLLNVQIPPANTPAFIVAASDDQLGLASHSVGIYSKWREARQSAELHMYAKGGHGFGMRKQKIPVDGWIDRFGDWLGQQGLLKPAKM